MRHWMTVTLLASGMFLATTAASAQGPWRDRGRDSDDRYSDRDRDRFGPGLVSRVLNDLDYARSYRFSDNHERKHFEQARRDLLRFQDNWRRGRFDRDRLDGAIDNIHHLVNADQVSPRDRRILARDMEALRELRDTRGGYGYGYGYRR